MTINTNKDNGADDYPNCGNPKLGSGVSDKEEFYVAMFYCACLISPVIYLLVTNHACH